MYTVKELSELTGETKRTIQFWQQSGLLIATENKGGRGTTNRYSEDELFYCEVIKKLKIVGFWNSTILSIVNSLRDKKDFKDITWCFDIKSLKNLRIKLSIEELV